MRKITDYSILFLLFIIVLVFISCKGEKIVQGNSKDSYKELRILLGSTITEDIKGGIVTIEYCPDNTCETFSMPDKYSKDKLSDFVYLYLYFISDYYYLDSFRKMVASEEINKIILRNKKSILINEQLKDAIDVMKFLVKEYSIKATFVRYDESERNEVVIDLKSVLEKK